jgi:hypothetical protein
VVSVRGGADIGFYQIPVLVGATAQRTFNTFGWIIGAIWKVKLGGYLNEKASKQIMPQPR